MRFGSSDGKLPFISRLGEEPPLPPLEVVGENNDYDAHIRHIDFHERYLSRSIEFQDLKAGTLIVLFGLFGGWLVRDQTILSQVSINLFSTLSVLAVTVLILWGISFLMAVAVIYPRTASAEEGFIFWKSVAQTYKQDAFVAKIMSVTAEELIEERLKHNYDLSRICIRKYRALQKSFIFGCLALLAIFLFYAVKELRSFVQF